MLLGETMRPPYWNVFFKFCSDALAMPNALTKKKYYTVLPLIMCLNRFKLCVNVFSPWYCAPALREACCKYFSRKGLRTSEQRWKAVRMYSSLQPRWQLSLQSTRVHRNAQDHRLADKTGLHVSKTLMCSQQTYGLELVLAVSCLRSWQ